MVSVDVTTACHLGLCIAVRLTEAVPLGRTMENQGYSPILNLSQLFECGLGKHSKQVSLL